MQPAKATTPYMHSIHQIKYQKIQSSIKKCDMLSIPLQAVKTLSPYESIAD